MDVIDCRTPEQIAGYYHQVKLIYGAIGAGLAIAPAFLYQFGGKNKWAALASIVLMIAVIGVMLLIP